MTYDWPADPGQRVEQTIDAGSRPITQSNFKATLSTEYVSYSLQNGFIVCKIDCPLPHAFDLRLFDRCALQNIRDSPSGDRIGATNP